MSTIWALREVKALRTRNFLLGGASPSLRAEGHEPGNEFGIDPVGFCTLPSGKGEGLDLGREQLHGVCLHRDKPRRLPWRQCRAFVLLQSRCSGAPRS